MPGKVQGQLVYELLSDGMTVDQIMKATRLSRRSVAQYKRRFEQDGGVTAPPEPEPRLRPVRQSQRKTAEEMLLQGKSRQEVAERVGLKEATVYKYELELKREQEEQKEPKRWEWPIDLQIKWVERVNVIRRYYGKEPFPMPGE